MGRLHLGRLLLGPGPIRRLGVVHIVQAFGDGLFVVSLAGSLFFNASTDAARPNILLYLLLTVAPFAVLAPLVGPFIDRVAQGYPRVVTLANAVRAGLCLLLAFHLRTVLFFPEALAVLVAGKTYAVATAALVPRLEPQRRDLLAANARLARLSAVGGTLGGAVGVGLSQLTGSAATVVLAGGAFAAAAWLSIGLQQPGTVPTFATPGEDLEELLDPDVVGSATGIAVLRAASGFLSFFVAFELKRSGAAPWMFGLVAATATAGALLGTFVGPALRRRYDEATLLRAGLVVPAVCCLLASVRVLPAVVAGCVLVVGMGSSIGRLAFDSILQSHAPDIDRARTFARFETRFQLAWVAGAVVPVGIRLPAWLGLLVVSSLLAGGAVAGNVERNVLRSRRLAMLPPVDLRRSVLEQARRLQIAGHHAHAVVEAALLAELVEPDGQDDVAIAAIRTLRELQQQAIEREVDEGDAGQAVRAAATLSERPARRPTSRPPG